MEQLFAEQSFGGETFFVEQLPPGTSALLGEEKPDKAAACGLGNTKKYQKLKQNKGKNFNDEFSGTEKVVNEL